MYSDFRLGGKEQNVTCQLCYRNVTALFRVDISHSLLFKLQLWPRNAARVRECKRALEENGGKSAVVYRHGRGEQRHCTPGSSLTKLIRNRGKSGPEGRREAKKSEGSLHSA
ncbi:hypothetical protein EVAR_3701_1 [Eumeta japonica]|uniref:Uncharacterized protein n=1 Tax=Eumeta variegata TaxID=151549 RepID=A0A4C1SUN9_EUMVA|nr:hypothetical protein EVAR_3701_1 [Eumeta japonica]